MANTTIQNFSRLMEEHINQSAINSGVTEVKKEDIKSWASTVYNELFNSVYGQFQSDDECAESAVFKVGHKTKESIVAYAMIVEKTNQKDKTRYPRLFELSAIWVDSEFRGRKELPLARDLRERCILWAHSQGATHIMSENSAGGEESQPSNAIDVKNKAKASLLKRGFVEVVEQDKPIQRRDLFILDLGQDTRKLNTNFETIGKQFGFDNLTDAITKTIELVEVVDLRSAILDGSIIKILLHYGFEAKEKLFCFGRFQNDLELESVMSESDLKQWLELRSVTVSAEEIESVTSCSKSSELEELIGERIWVVDWDTDFKMLDFLGNFDNKANEIYNLNCFCIGERSGWRMNDIWNVFSEFEVKAN